MIDIKVTVHGVEELDRKFLELAETITKPGEAWPAVAKEFREIEREQFFTSGHGKWAPLTRPYEAWKEREFPFSPLMRATDALYRSLTQDGADGAVYEATDTSLTLGSSVTSKKGRPYPVYHQEGAGRNPERKLIDLSDADKKRLFKPIVRTMARNVQRAGFIQTEIEDLL